MQIEHIENIHIYIYVSSIYDMSTSIMIYELVKSKQFSQCVHGNAKQILCEGAIVT